MHRPVSEGPQPTLTGNVTYAKGKQEYLLQGGKSVTFPTVPVRPPVTLLLKGISQFGLSYLKSVLSRTKLSFCLSGVFFPSSQTYFLTKWKWRSSLTSNHLSTCMRWPNRSKHSLEGEVTKRHTNRPHESLNFFSQDNQSLKALYSNSVIRLWCRKKDDTAIV